MISSQRILGASAAVCIALAFFALRPHEAPANAARDFGVYYEAGRAFLEHRDAYAPTALGMPFVSMPQTLPLFALFALPPYETSVALWDALLALAYGALVFCLRRLMSLSLEQTAYTAILLLAFVPLTSNFALGQSALPGYAAAMMSLTLTIAPIASAVSIAFTTLQPSAGLGVLALAGFARGRAILVGAALLIYCVGAVVNGPLWFVHFAHVAFAAMASEKTDVIQYTPFSILHGFGMPPVLARVVAWCLAAIAVIAALVGCLRVARTTLQRFAIIGCATVFFATFFHEHNFIVLVAPIVFCLSIGRRAIAPLAIVGSTLVSVHWLNFAQRPQEAAQDVALAIAFVCACGALAKLPTRTFLSAAIPTVAIVVLGAWVGAHHPVPSWIGADALHLSANSANDLWEKEQLQAGFLEPNAAAALLRSLALIGSAMLLYLTLNIDVHEIVERRDGVRMEIL